MLIYNSILAGEILFLLETSRSLSLEQLVIKLGKPFHDIQLAIERLVEEGLAVIDVDRNIVKLEKVPEYIHEQKFQQRAYASV